MTDFEWMKNVRQIIDRKSAGEILTIREKEYLHTECGWLSRERLLEVAKEIIHFNEIK